MFQSSMPPTTPTPPAVIDADWIARSTATGVLVADRLETQARLTAWLVNDATAGHVSVDTSTEVSGAVGSFKFNVLNTDSSASGSICVPFGTTRGAGATTWFSYRVRAPYQFASQPWSRAGTPAHKLSIFSRDANGVAPTGSNQANECVVQVNNNAALIDAYHQDGSSFPPEEVSAVTNCSATDVRREPKVDNSASLLPYVTYPLSGNSPETGAAWTSCEQDRRKFGGLYSAASATTYPYQRGYGDPLAGGFRQRPSEWLTITGRVQVGTFGTASSRWSLWAALEGQAYFQIFDSQNITLGASGPDYNGLTLLPYTSNRSPGGRKVTAQGSEIGGVTMLNVGVGTHLGVGTLEYVASTGAFRFKTAADSYGTARYFSHANGIDIINLASSSNAVATTLNGAVTLPQATISLTSSAGLPVAGTVVVGEADTTNPGASHGSGEQRVQYTGVSGNQLTGCTGGTGTHDSGAPVGTASYIQLRLDSTASLPGSGTTTASVTIGEGRPDTQINYNDVIVSTLPINAPGGYAPFGVSALADLAASMSAGSWAQLTVSNQDSILGNDLWPTSKSMIHFCNSMPWNPLSKVIEIIGMDHNYTSQRHVRYDDVTNQFVLVADDDGMGSATQHGYDHNTVNPNTGDIYQRKYSLNTGTISSYKKAYGASSFAALPGVAANNGGEQVAIGACWWSGTFTGGGTQGSWMIFNGGNAALPDDPVNSLNDGQVVAYNPLTNAWFFNQAGMAPHFDSGSTGYTLHSVMEYSSVRNVAVYGGGNSATQKLWRLNSDGTKTAMPDVPAGKSVGIQLGSLTVDPVSGNFLLLSAGELWELNPTGSGTWTQQTGSRVPPAGVGVPGPVTRDGMIACAIPDYGVVAYIKQTSSTGGTFYLYKHA